MDHILMSLGWYLFDDNVVLILIIILRNFSYDAVWYIKVCHWIDRI